MMMSGDCSFTLCHPRNGNKGAAETKIAGLSNVTKVIDFAFMFESFYYGLATPFT